MAVVTLDVEQPKYGIAGGVPIPVDMHLTDAAHVFVWYGNSRLPAIQNTDYTVELALDFGSFIVTPLASLITKITTLMASEPGEINVAFIERLLPLTSDFEESDGFSKRVIAQTFDETTLKLQQLSHQFKQVTEVSFDNVEAAGAVMNSDIDVDDMQFVNAISANLTGVDPGKLITRGLVSAAVAAQIATAVLSTQLTKVANRTELKALNIAISPVFLAEGYTYWHGGRSGVFYWDASIAVTVHQMDRQEGVYVAPNPAVAGAWARKYDILRPAHFGAVGDFVIDDHPAVQAFYDFLKINRVAAMLPGRYAMGARLDIGDPDIHVGLDIVTPAGGVDITGNILHCLAHGAYTGDVYKLKDLITAGIDTLNDIIYAKNHGMSTGDEMVLQAWFLIPNSDFTLTTHYWFIKVDDNRFRVATSLADANAGTYMLLTSTFNLVFRSANADIVFGTSYYTIRLTANTFQLATSLANAIAGTAKDLTDTNHFTLASLGRFDTKVINCSVIFSFGLYSSTREVINHCLAGELQHKGHFEYEGQFFVGYFHRQHRNGMIVGGIGTGINTSRCMWDKVIGRSFKRDGLRLEAGGTLQKIEHIQMKDCGTGKDSAYTLRGNILSWENGAMLGSPAVWTAGSGTGALTQRARLTVKKFNYIFDAGEGVTHKEVDTTTDILYYTGHGLANGTVVYSDRSASGLSINNTYYVHSAAADSFKLSSAVYPLITQVNMTQTLGVVAPFILYNGVPPTLAIRDNVNINGQPFIVMDFDIANGTIDLFPWIIAATDLALWPAHNEFIYGIGGGTYVGGLDSNIHQLGIVDGSNCGTSYKCDALYPPTVRQLHAASGILGAQIGGSPSDASLGGSIDSMYIEASGASTLNDILFCGTGIIQFVIGSPITFDFTNWHYMVQNDGTNRYHQPLGQSVVVLHRDGAIWQQQNLVANFPLAVLPVYTKPSGITFKSARINGACNVQLKEFPSSNRMFGYDTVLFYAQGFGTGDAPNGIWSFTPDAGYTANGGASGVAVTFANMAYPTLYVAYLNVTTKAWRVFPIGGQQMFASAAGVDPALLTGPASVTGTVAVAGAALGDRFDATFSLDLQGVDLKAYVSAAGIVTYKFFLDTGAVDLGSGTLRLFGRKPPA